MKNIYIKLSLFTVIISTFIISACNEDKLAPLEKNTNPPGKVRDVVVENEAGKANISYVLPNDQDLLYVKAEYEIRPGITREIKASYYTNSMELDGFADTKEYEVKVYAVNRSEVSSEPTIVKVKPLENPIWEVFRSIKILPDFSGVRINAQNPKLANVAIEIMKKDSLGNWKPFLPFVYSSTKDISHTTRGLDTLGQEFGVTVRDKYLNYTDTIYQGIKPLYEELMEKSRFKEITLPGDAKIQKVTRGIPTLWDGNNNSGNSNRMLTEVADPNPQWITIDIGQLTKLSRIKIWNYAEFLGGGNNQFYYRGQMKHFEVWGSVQPNNDGSWDSSWIKLGTFENIKPSGLPYGQNSPEDQAKANAGFDYDLDFNAPKVRYLRIKSNENWMGTTWFEILELNVYGDPR